MMLKNFSHCIVFSAKFGHLKNPNHVKKWLQHNHLEALLRAYMDLLLSIQEAAAFMAHNQYRRLQNQMHKIHVAITLVGDACK